MGWGEFRLYAENQRICENVLVGGEPIDPDRSYMLAEHSFMLLDNQVLIDYHTETLDGVVGAENHGLYGQGWIMVN